MIYQFQLVHRYLVLLSYDILRPNKNDEIIISKVKNADWQYLKAVSSTLEAEWLSEADGDL